MNNSLNFKKEEFLFHILNWDPKWISNGTDINETLLRNPVISLSSTPPLLAYSTFDDYYKVQFSYLLYEFWYKLIKGYNRKKSGPQPIFSSIELFKVPHSTQLIQVNSDNKVVSFLMQTFEKVQAYPVPDLLVKFTNPMNENREQIAFIESRRLQKVNSDSIETTTYKFEYKLITKYMDKIPEQIIIVPIVSRIGIYMNFVEALLFLPKLPLYRALLQPNINDYQFLSINDNDIQSLVTEDNLDSNQLEIVAKVVKTVSERQRKICCIKGPAGTGKTTIIVNSILSLISRGTRRISICAKSNLTIDSLVLQLLKKRSLFTQKGVPLNVLRFGSERHMDQRVKPVSFATLKNNLQPGEDASLLFRNANVIATTLSSFCTNPRYKPYFDGLDISACFIDDAAYANELESFIPLKSGVTTLILVGDSKQLLPKLYSKDVKNNIPDESLFVRAQKIFKDAEKNPILTLDTQYRMAESIADWPNKFFYKGALKNNATPEPLGFCNYRLINHLSPEEEDGFTNIGEAKLVVNIAYTLIAQINLDKVNKKIDLGIITTCFEQMHTITAMMEQRILHISNERKDKINVEVNIVEGFQNREYDVIIMSCVRSSNVDYIDNPHRLCVSLTRAKHTLIVCGNFTEYNKNLMWKNLIDDSQKRNSYFTVKFEEGPSTLKQYFIADE